MPTPALNLDLLTRHSFVERVEWHPTLPSTNDHALALAEHESLDTPLLVLADEQTAGRGRGANRWWSRQGGLTFSLILATQADRSAVGSRAEISHPDALRPDHWPRVALTAGLSLCEALEELAPHLDYGLKWPNDVILGGKKLAGVLVEIPPARGSAPRRLVLGVGINVNNSLTGAPPEIQETAAALCDSSGLEFDTTQILLVWLTRFAANLPALAADDSDLASRWQSRCVLTGRTIELQSGDRHLCGLCRGIAADGSLLLDSAGGLERVYAGVLVRVAR